MSCYARWNILGLLLQFIVTETQLSVQNFIANIHPIVVKIFHLKPQVWTLWWCNKTFQIHDSWTSTCTKSVQELWIYFILDQSPKDRLTDCYNAASMAINEYCMTYLTVCCPIKLKKGEKYWKDIIYLITVAICVIIIHLNEINNE